MEVMCKRRKLKDENLWFYLYNCNGYFHFRDSGVIPVRREIQNGINIVDEGCRC